LDVTLFRNRTVSVAVTAGLSAALVIGGALLPLLYFLQTVQKVSPISAIVRLMPLMVAAAAFAPVAGELRKLLIYLRSGTIEWDHLFCS
jgi:hypothetical protein